MCQPAPGPRCSSDMREALNAARRTRGAAERDYEAAYADYRAHIGRTSQPHREVHRQAWATFREADAAYEHALREYETTPEGQNMLERAIERLDADASAAEPNSDAAKSAAWAAQAARTRLDEARATRERQKTDLNLSRAQAARLADLTGEEIAALDQADAATRSAERALTAAQAASGDAQQSADEAEHAYVAAMSHMVAVRQSTEPARQEVLDAQVAARAEAKRLYVAAGVSERYAGYYADDMLATATGGRPGAPLGTGRATGAPLAQTGLRMKVKRTGSDRDATLAAQATAGHDADYCAANARLTRAIAEHSRAQQAVSAAEAQVRPVMEERNALMVARGRANYATADATTAVDSARAHGAHLRARIVAGIGVHTIPEPLGLDRARDQVVRQPDGTTNAYLYRAPSDGFPHGRYVAVTGITTVHGQAPVNALTLEDGTVLHASERYSRTHRGGGQTACQVPQVLLVPAAEGARPLREENLATAGFATFVDSTD